MKRFTLALHLSLLTLSLFPQEKRLALVIGNSDYQYGGELTNPVNDANSMEQVLKAVGFDVIKYENLDQKMMRQAIDNFGNLLKNYNIGLFFYAGHGVQAKGFNYLIPVDAVLASETDVEYNCVRADRILGKMEDAANRTNIVILDACRNNPFERSWTRSPAGKGLAFMNAPTGSLIAYATSPGNTASDGTGANGLYTSALLTYIVEPNITVLEMFQKTRTMVREQSNGDQVPWESTSLEGNFYFNESNLPIPIVGTSESLTGKTILSNISNDSDILRILNIEGRKDSTIATLNKGENENITIGKKYYLHIPTYKGPNKKGLYKIQESQIIGEIKITSYLDDQAIGDITSHSDTITEFESLNYNNIILERRRKIQFSMGVSLIYLPRVSLCFQSHKFNPYRRTWYGLGLSYYFEGLFIPDLEIGGYFHPYRINRWNTGIVTRLRWSKMDYPQSGDTVYPDHELFGPSINIKGTWKFLYFEIGAFYYKNVNSDNEVSMNGIYPDVGLGITL